MGVAQQGKKKSFTFAEGCSHRPESDRQNTLSGISLVFISLSLTLMDGFGFTIFAIDYLEKGAHGVRGSLKQAEQENSFRQYSSLSKQLEIRHLVINSSLFDHKNLVRLSNVSQNM
jgi:hypothetical protein